MLGGVVIWGWLIGFKVVVWVVRCLVGLWGIFGIMLLLFINVVKLFCICCDGVVVDLKDWIGVSWRGMCRWWGWKILCFGGLKVVDWLNGFGDGWYCDFGDW